MDATRKKCIKRNWPIIFEEFHRSGLSITEFCQTKSISLSLFYLRHKEYPCPNAYDVDDIIKTGKIKEALAEKAHAVDMWKQAEALASSITPKYPRDTDFMRVSTTYGRIKYQIFEQIWRIQLMLADERINNKELDNQKSFSH
jgi:hypothetical protein